MTRPVSVKDQLQRLSARAVRARVQASRQRGVALPSASRAAALLQPPSAPAKVRSAAVSASQMRLYMAVQAEQAGLGEAERQLRVQWLLQCSAQPGLVSGSSAMPQQSMRA